MLVYQTVGVSHKNLSILQDGPRSLQRCRMPGKMTLRVKQPATSRRIFHHNSLGECLLQRECALLSGGNILIHFTMFSLPPIKHPPINRGFVVGLHISGTIQGGT